MSSGQTQCIFFSSVIESTRAVSCASMCQVHSAGSISPYTVPEIRGPFGDGDARDTSREEGPKLTEQAEVAKPLIRVAVMVMEEGV